MAEALLRKIAKEENIEVEARSAGVSAVNGSLASSQALQVLSEKGIDHSHRSQMVEASLVEWADLILTMTQNHKYFLMNDFPESIDKIYTLKEYASLDPQKEELLGQLDQLYAEMASIRAGIQTKFGLKADEPWNEEAESLWLKEIEPLVKKEQQLLSQLEESSQDLDVSDPFGGSVDIYRECAKELESNICRIIHKWKKEKE
jgi:protein-tyrosine phosphatase